MSFAYDCIVIGLGHAGCEAALAAARLGARTLALTLSRNTIATMPCNPAVGGPAKGHLVREIDALGGQMALITDQTHLHIRMLNTGKGPAVQALRAQVDKAQYAAAMGDTVLAQPNLTVREAQAADLLVADGRVQGVTTAAGEIFRAGAVVVTTGTFLRGLCHIGDHSFAAGRSGERPAVHLSKALQALGFTLARLKTGTPPRVDRRSVDVDRMTPQAPSPDPLTFSMWSPRVRREPQQPCYLTATTAQTKAVVLANLHRSAMYGGHIQGTGPRYCPSIEDKMVRFADKETHQVFLEPEGWQTNEMYVQGMSTSLPLDVQQAYLRTVIGLERCEIVRPGYAVEYDFVNPIQLYHSLESRQVQGLFLAGQINGTSGYEEAAAQGLMAGINAARYAGHSDPLVFSRSESYIGVLIDDLVTKGTQEPYRMMTSRAEYRLMLRHDNADARLCPVGAGIGLLPAERHRQYLMKQADLQQMLHALSTTRVSKSEALAAAQGIVHGSVNPGASLLELLKRPEVQLRDLAPLLGDHGARLIAMTPDTVEQVEIQVKYEGYIKRQQEQIQRFESLERQWIPESVDYSMIRAMSMEAREKLAKFQPSSIGVASRISGVSPADVSALLVYLEQHRRQHALAAAG